MEKGLPACAVGSFVPSIAFLCFSGDCFCEAFEEYRQRVDESMCASCGSTKIVLWRSGGERAKQYQVCFVGAGITRTDGSMLKRKKVITAESSICNPYHTAFYLYVT